jgi:hypothetical protein
LLCAPQEKKGGAGATHTSKLKKRGEKRERGEEQGGRKKRRRKEEKKKKKKNVRTPEATGSLIDQSVVPRRDGFTLPTGYVPVIVLRQSRTAAHLSPSLQNKETTLISKVI